MADYYARVELHGAKWPADYLKLHEKLKEHGFTNCLFTDAGLLRLPTGSYYSTNRVDDVAVVAQAVKYCANATGYANEVFVIKDGGWRAYLSIKC